MCNLCDSVGWISEKVQKIQSLKGETIIGYVITEEPLREYTDEDDDIPLYTDPTSPFIQLWGLYLNLSSGATVKFSTYQNDEFFGIFLALEKQYPEFKSWEPDLDGKNLGDYLPTRVLEDFPTGQITSVEVLFEMHTISEVLINISGDPILLVAGEVGEDYMGMYITKMDGSIILFRHPEQKIEVEFFPLDMIIFPRQHLTC